MRIMLLTDDRETARRYRSAADELHSVRVNAVKTLAQALEWMFREPFDALLSDDPRVLHPRIRKCPVLWPGSVCLLLREPIEGRRLPRELTFCFPFEEDPVKVVQRIAGFPCERAVQRNGDVLTSRFLQKLGVPVSLIGFECMREAIRLMLTCERFTDVGSLQEIYEIVADVMQISAFAAEHAVRQAVNASFIRADARLLEQVFGYTVDAERAAPSNAAFLFRAADHIRLIMRGDKHDAC